MEKKSSCGKKAGVTTVFETALVNGIPVKVEKMVFQSGYYRTSLKTVYRVTYGNYSIDDCKTLKAAKEAIAMENERIVRQAARTEFFKKMDEASARQSGFQE